MNPQELKECIDLADYVRLSGVELKKHGRDLVGLCPFHEDGDPSLVVTPGKQLWHCLGCGKGGSVIDFVMERDKCSVGEALKQLKEENAKHNLPGPGSGSGPGGGSGAKPLSISPERERQLFERTIVYYEKQLTNEVPWNYLESRGLSGAGAKLLGRMRVGYSDGTLLKILPTSGPVHEELKALGILTECDGAQPYERFKGCLVFPVFDLTGNVTTLYGRHLGDPSSPKGCAATRGTKRHLYLPDRPTGLWNIAAAQSFHEIILVESTIDALSVMVAGYENVISIQGTNGLSTGGAAILTSCGVTKIRILMDGDKAGKAAAARLLERLQDDVSGEILELPDGHDPNSFLMEHGPSELALFLAESRVELKGKAIPQQSLPGGGFEVVCGVRRYHLFGLEKGPRKLRVTVRLEHAGKLHVDTLDLYNARARQQLCRDLCRVFEQSPETVEADLARLLTASESAELKTVGDEEQPESAQIELTQEERAEAEALGKAGDLIETILKDFEICGLIGEEINKLLGYLAMTSRKMSEPLSVLILSSSGAGKTALQDAVLAFCPPEDLVKLTSLSGKALFYKDRLSLKHKILALEEGAGAEEAAYAIRNLISADSLTTEVTVRDPVTGNMTTMQNTVEGPAGVFVTTTNPQVDPETKSRFLVTGIDESRQQTRRILDCQRKRHGMTGLDEDLEADKVIARHRNFQRLLKPVAVVNNHADRLTFDDDRLQARRLQPQYLGLISAVAFLRQMTRPVQMHNGVEYIKVDEEDVRIGNEIAVEILGRTLDELTIPGRNLLELLVDLVDHRIESDAGQAHSDTHPVSKSEIQFTRREIREFSGWTNTRLHIHLKELIEHEYVLLESGRSNSLQHYRLVYDGQGQDGSRFIPGVKA